MQMIDGFIALQPPQITWMCDQLGSIQDSLYFIQADIVCLLTSMLPAEHTQNCNAATSYYRIPNVLSLPIPVIQSKNAQIKILPTATS